MIFDGRETLVLAILTLFLGKYLNHKVSFLKNYNIPEPVTGGVLASVSFAVLRYLEPGQAVLGHRLTLAYDRISENTAPCASFRPSHTSQWPPT